MKEKDERFEHKYVIIPENPCEEIWISLELNETEFSTNLVESN
jgi:hypothetical protein